MERIFPAFHFSAFVKSQNSLFPKLDLKLPKMSTTSEEWILDAEEEAFVISIAVNLYQEVQYLIQKELPAEASVRAKRELITDRLDHLIKHADRVAIIEDYVEYMGQDSAVFNVFKCGDPMDQILFDGLWRQVLLTELMAEHLRKPLKPKDANDTLVLSAGRQPTMPAVFRKAIVEAASVAATQVGERLYHRLQGIKRKRSEEREEEEEEEGTNSPPCATCRGYNDRTGCNRCSLCFNAGHPWYVTATVAEVDSPRAEQAKKLRAAVHACENVAGARDGAASALPTTIDNQDQVVHCGIGANKTQTPQECALCGASCRHYLCDKHTIYHSPKHSPKSSPSSSPDK